MLNDRPGRVRELFDAAKQSLFLSLNLIFATKELAHGASAECEQKNPARIGILAGRIYPEPDGRVRAV